MAFGAVAADRVAVTHTYCGVRSGTAGNAFLDGPRGQGSLTLAEQGRSQHLLSEIDALVGPDGRETGTQNGRHYCAVVQLNSKGEPIKVIKAWRQSR